MKLKNAFFALLLLSSAGYTANTYTANPENEVYTADDTQAVNCGLCRSPNEEGRGTSLSTTFHCGHTFCGDCVHIAAVDLLSHDGKCSTCRMNTTAPVNPRANIEQAKAIMDALPQEQRNRLLNTAQEVEQAQQEARQRERFLQQMNDPEFRVVLAMQAAQANKNESTYKIPYHRLGMIPGFLSSSWMINSQNSLHLTCAVLGFLVMPSAGNYLLEKCRPFYGLVQRNNGIVEETPFNWRHKLHGFIGGFANGAQLGLNMKTCLGLFHLGVQYAEKNLITR